MEPEDKKILEETLALNKENNQMLHKLITYQKWNQAIKIISWVFIILTSLGAVYFIEQNLGSLIGVYTGGVGTTDIGNVTNSLNGNKSDIQDLLKSL